MARGDGPGPLPAIVGGVIAVVVLVWLVGIVISTVVLVVRIAVIIGLVWLGFWVWSRFSHD